MLPWRRPLWRLLLQNSGPQQLELEFRLLQLQVTHLCFGLMQPPPLAVVREVLRHHT
jgi:hypothetical protein